MPEAAAKDERLRQLLRLYGGGGGASAGGCSIAVGTSKVATETRSVQPQRLEVREDQWTMAKWLESLTSPSHGKLSNLVANCLSWNISEECRLKLLLAIGEENDLELAIRLITTSGLAQELAELLLYGAKELIGSQTIHLEEALHAKFVQDPGTLQPAPRGGLEELQQQLGIPRVDSLEAMWEEHCNSADSDETWQANTYGLTTSSRIEWAFVVDPKGGPEPPVKPVEADLEKVRCLTVPCAPRGPTSPKRPPTSLLQGESVSPYVSFRTFCDSRHEVFRKMGDGGAIWPKEKNMISADSERVPRDLQDFKREFDWVNKLLLTKGQKNKTETEAGAEAAARELLPEEFVALRLYTGPMSEKYGAALQSCLREPESPVRYRMLCRGNKYTTTLHVISAALLKLSRLPCSTACFRVAQSEILKPEMGDERPIVDYGFMTATASEATALASVHAAAPTQGSPMLIAINDSRGVDVAWLSQYPHEAEIVFGPFAGVEVSGARVLFSVPLAEMRLQLDLRGLTVEHLASRRRRILRDLVACYIDEVMRTYSAEGAPQLLDKLGLSVQLVHEILQGEFEQLTNVEVNAVSNDIELRRLLHEASELKDRWRFDLLPGGVEELDLCKLVGASSFAELEDAWQRLDADLAAKEVRLRLFCWHYMQVGVEADRRAADRAFAVFFEGDIVKSLYKKEPRYFWSTTRRKFIERCIRDVSSQMQRIFQLDGSVLEAVGMPWHVAWESVKQELEGMLHVESDLFFDSDAELKSVIRDALGLRHRWSLSSLPQDLRSEEDIRSLVGASGCTELADAWARLDADADAKEVRIRWCCLCLLRPQTKDTPLFQKAVGLILHDRGSVTKQSTFRIWKNEASRSRDSFFRVAFDEFASDVVHGIGSETRQFLDSFEKEDMLLRHYGITEATLAEIVQTRLTHIVQREEGEVFSSNKKVLEAIELALHVKDHWVPEHLMLSVLGDKACLFQLVGAEDCEDFDAAVQRLQGGDSSFQAGRLRLLASYMRMEGCRYYARRAIITLVDGRQNLARYLRDAGASLEVLKATFPLGTIAENEQFTVDDLKSGGFSAAETKELLGLCTPEDARGLLEMGLRPKVGQDAWRQGEEVVMKPTDFGGKVGFDRIWKIDGDLVQTQKGWPLSATTGEGLMGAKAYRLEWA